jgi:hypothetical protein
MALVSDPVLDEAEASDGGLIVRTSSNERATEVDVLGPDGIFTVSVPGFADDQAASRFLAVFRQVVSVRFDVRDHEVAATVRGIRHRLPAEQAVGLSAALSLAARGIPTLVVREVR